MPKQEKQPIVVPVDARGSRLLPWLLVLFMGSGCAALIFEVVWLQLLQLVIGSSAISLGVLLGTFMGGMCLGSLLFPRLVGPRRHPLRVYAMLELGIGLFGIAMLYLIPTVGQFYTAYVGHGLWGMILRAVVCAVCLLPPTFLMGATLPALARWTETTPRGISWMGYFYGSNIAGAVLGCLIAGFYLLRIFDVYVASYVAAWLNGIVAMGGMLLSFAGPYSATEQPEDERAGTMMAGATTVYAAIALSGLCAMGSQVVWNRLLSLLLGATVYTFSITLAVFLVGLGIGSSLGSAIARHTRVPRLLLGATQLLLTAAMAWSAYMLTESIPNWPVQPTLSQNPWYDFQLDIVRCFWGVFPATVLWGASFPLALAAAARDGQDPARLVGTVYAANTVGAILGSLLAAVVLVGWIGTQNTQRVLIWLAGVSGIVVLLPMLWRTPLAVIAGSLLACAMLRWWIGPERTLRLSIWVALISTLAVVLPMFWRGPRSRLLPQFSESKHVSWGRRILGTLALVGALGGAAWLVKSVPERNGLLVAHGRMLAADRNSVRVVYFDEGLNSSVAVTESGSTKYFHVSGKVEASTEPHDMRLQRMLGHLPAMLHPKPKSVLIVGCGAGVTAGSFIIHPDVERIVLCEIEPLIPKVVATHFAEQNHNLIKDPRVEIIYDDARHYILTTRETFDIITSDPIHPWVKGSATLYSEEYLELCKQRLNPGGIVTQWVPLYQSTEPVVKSELATFFKVFPDGTIWANDIAGEGYDVVVLGQREPGRIDLDELQQRLTREPYAKVATALREVGFRTGISLLGTYTGHAADFQEYLKDAQINTDRSLRLQYLAGLGLNAFEGNDIYRKLLARRRYPADLFAGSDELRQSLRELLGIHD